MGRSATESAEPNRKQKRRRPPSSPHREAAPPPIARFLEFIRPAGDAYSSPLNPVFLGELTSVRAINARPVWMARDGLLPLLWFFAQNPSPTGVRARVLVEAAHVRHVPRAWIPSCGAYRVVSRVPSRLHAGGGLASTGPLAGAWLLAGWMMDTWCSLKHLDRLFDAALADGARPARALVFLPTCLEGFGNEHRHDFLVRFVARICERVGVPIEALDYRGFMALSNLQGVRYLELNEELLCSDSSFLQHALARGARRAGLAPAMKAASPWADAASVDLSPYHSIEWRPLVAEDLPEAEPSLDGQGASPSAYLRAIRASEAATRFPWDAWLTAFARLSRNS